MQLKKGIRRGLQNGHESKSMKIIVTRHNKSSFWPQKKSTSRTKPSERTFQKRHRLGRIIIPIVSCTKDQKYPKIKITRIQ